MTAQAFDSVVDQAFNSEFVGEPCTEEEIQEFENEDGPLDLN